MILCIEIEMKMPKIVYRNCTLKVYLNFDILCLDVRKNCNSTNLNKL